MQQRSRRRAHHEPAPINLNGPAASESGDMPANGDDLVAQRAYQRFEERGCEHGHDQEDWFAAEREIRGRSRTGT